MFWIKIYELIKNNKTLQKILYAVLFMVIGGIITVLLFFPKKIIEEHFVTVPDTSWTVVLNHVNHLTEILEDIAGMYPIYDTVFSIKDTIIIKPGVCIEDIPPVKETVKDSFPVLVNGKKYYLPFLLFLTYRGIFYEYGIKTVPTPHKIPIPVYAEPRLRVYKYVGLTNEPLVDWKAIVPSLGAGVVYNKKLDFTGRVYVDRDSTYNFHFKADVKFYW